MNVKEIGAVREKKKEHVLRLMVEFDEPVSEREAVERVMQRLSDKPQIILNKEPESEKEERKNRVKIDWDKACALKLAGWKNKDIVAELHASEGAIDNGMYKHLIKYQEGNREGRCEEVEEA